MIVKLLTEHYLEFLSFKGGCTGLSESTHVKMPHVMAQLLFFRQTTRSNRVNQPMVCRSLKSLCW